MNVAEASCVRRALRNAEERGTRLPPWLTSLSGFANESLASPLDAGEYGSFQGVGNGLPDAPLLDMLPHKVPHAYPRWANRFNYKFWR